MKMSDDFINFPFDVPDSPVYGGFGHMQLLLYFHQTVGLYAQVEYGPLFVGEIALLAEKFAFGLGELRLDVQKPTRLIYALSASPCSCLCLLSAS